MSDDIIRKALGMDIVSPEEKESQVSVEVIDGTNAAVETDFQYVIDNLKELIAKGQDSIDELVLIAKQSQHPRAYEVIATLLKATADMNMEILNSHKKKKDIAPSQADHSKGVSTSNVTNNLFVGSTAELQNFLDQQQKKK